MGEWEDSSFIFVLPGAGREKHQEEFVLCGFGSMPVCLDGSVGFLLLF